MSDAERGEGKAEGPVKEQQTGGWGVGGGETDRVVTDVKCH